MSIPTPITSSTRLRSDRPPEDQLNAVVVLRPNRQPGADEGPPTKQRQRQRLDEVLDREARHHRHHAGLRPAGAGQCAHHVRGIDDPTGPPRGETPHWQRGTGPGTLPGSTAGSSRSDADGPHRTASQSPRTGPQIADDLAGRVEPHGWLAGRDGTAASRGRQPCPPGAPPGENAAGDVSLRSAPKSARRRQRRAPVRPGLGPQVLGPRRY